MGNLNQMSPSEFLKYAAENHIKITLPEDRRKYPMQQCQDVSLNEDFRTLHKDIVNCVIQFCAKHNIMIDEFSLSADSLEDSIRYGSWQSTTDSCLTFTKHSQEYKDVTSMRKKVSDTEYKKIINNEEPYLMSI